MTIRQDAANVGNYGAVVEFLQIDLTAMGESVYRFYNSIDITEPLGEITFLGVDWKPVPYESEGWAVKGTGATARPTITISDYDGLFLFLSSEIDLVGGKVHRYETTYENIAGGSYYGPEIWLINQLIESDGYMMKWGLAAPFDQKTRKIPGWIMTRDEFPGIAVNKFS